MTQTSIVGWQKGLGWGKLETKLGPVRPDLWYKRLGLAIEVDTGTASIPALKAKAQKYSGVSPGVKRVAFVTLENVDRARRFLEAIPLAQVQKIGATFSNLEKLFSSFP